MPTYGPWVQPPDFAHNPGRTAAWRGGGVVQNGPAGDAIPGKILEGLAAAFTSDTPVTGLFPRSNVSRWDITATLGDPNAPTVYRSERLFKEWQADVGAKKTPIPPSNFDYPPGAIGYQFEDQFNTVASAVLTVRIGAHNYDTSGGGDPLTGVGAPMSTAEWNARVVDTTYHYALDADYQLVVYGDGEWKGRAASSNPPWMELEFSTSPTLGDARDQTLFSTYDITSSLRGRTASSGRNVDGIFSLTMFHDVVGLPSLIDASLDDKSVMFGHDLECSITYTIRPARYRFVFPDDEPVDATVRVLRQYPRDDAYGFGSTGRNYPRPSGARNYGGQP